MSIREGRWADFIENAVDKLPAGVSDVAKNVLMTKESTVFRGLNRFVQYGDFVGKAVLYDHLKAEGKPEREALDTILEAFVQYNRNSGRTRGYLEDTTGLLWFMSYKLRILKVAKKMFQEKPLQFVATELGTGSLAGVRKGRTR